MNELQRKLIHIAIGVLGIVAIYLVINVIVEKTTSTNLEKVSIDGKKLDDKIFKEYAFSGVELLDDVKYASHTIYTVDHTHQTQVTANNQEKTIVQIQTQDKRMKTDKKIHVGSSLDDVKKAYGDKYKENDNFIIYKDKNKQTRLKFEIKNAKVESILLEKINF